MKRVTTIVLFAGMLAVTVGILGFSGNSATANMISALPQSQDNVGMLGHVEYKVLDEFGSIKQYMQNDNIVVQVGKDCVARAVFDTSENLGLCVNNLEFQYIAIGNGTGGTIDDAQTDLANAQCATSGGAGSNGGEMARKLVTPTFVQAGSGTGTIVTLDLSSDPFTFGSSNATSVIDSGIFNAQESVQDGEKQCGTLGTTEMFSIQELNAQVGIAVSDGDSLSVKWTITIG